MIALWNASGMVTIGRPEMIVLTRLIPCCRTMSTIRVASPLITHRGKPRAQVIEQLLVQLDHHQGFRGDSRIDQSLRDRTSAGTELDHVFARRPAHRFGDRPRQHPGRRDHRAHRLGRTRPLPKEQLGFLGLANLRVMDPFSLPRADHRIRRQISRRACTRRRRHVGSAAGQAKALDDVYSTPRAPSSPPIRQTGRRRDHSEGRGTWQSRPATRP